MLKAKTLFVTINILGGISVLSGYAIGITGAPENPISDSYLENKFRNLTDDVLSTEQRETLLDRLWHMETVNDLGEILGLTRVSQRQSRD